MERRYFEIMRDGRVFCLCEMVICDCGNGECSVLSPIHELVTCIRDKVPDFILSVGFSAEEDALREKWNVVPYRFQIRIRLERLSRELVYLALCSSFDSRFPGGMHLKKEFGAIADVVNGFFLSPSFRLFPSADRKLRRALSLPMTFSADGDTVWLVCSGGKCGEELNSFCESYKKTCDMILRINKKTLDKVKNI